MAIKQRRKVANYMDLNKTGSGEAQYEFMGTGFKDLNENPGAQTGSRRYINDKSTTKSIKGYEFQSAFNADYIESEKVIADIVEIGKLQKTGSDAERDYVIVDLDKKASGGGVSESSYEARKIRVAVEVNQFGSDDGDMTCEGNLLGIGDVIPGSFDIKTKKFTPTVVAG